MKLLHRNCISCKTKHFTYLQLHKNELFHYNMMMTRSNTRNKNKVQGWQDPQTWHERFRHIFVERKTQELKCAVMLKGIKM